jgi:hypothetical protein
MSDVCCGGNCGCHSEKPELVFLDKPLIPLEADLITIAQEEKANARRAKAYFWGFSALILVLFFITIFEKIYVKSN